MPESRHPKIRQALDAARAEAQERIESGFLSDDDQQAFEAFVADLDAFVAELEDTENLIDGQRLFGGLMELLQKCTGRLERLKPSFEDALSNIPTLM